MPYGYARELADNERALLRAIILHLDDLQGFLQSPSETTATVQTDPCTGTFADINKSHRDCILHCHKTIRSSDLHLQDHKTRMSTIAPVRDLIAAIVVQLALPLLSWPGYFRCSSRPSSSSTPACAGPGYRHETLSRLKAELGRNDVMRIRFDRSGRSAGVLVVRQSLPEEVRL